MPISKKRKNIKKRSEEAAPRRSIADGVPLSPKWWAPLMVTLMVLGLVLVVATYLFKGAFPVPSWGNWNLAVGFGIAMAGFLMTMRWR